MNRITRISAGLVIGLFIAAALAIFPGVAAAQTLNISIESETGGSPPGELVVTDPSGERTGPYAPDIQLPNPMNGLYNLRVIGLKTGTYPLFSRLIAAAAAPRMCGSPI